MQHKSTFILKWIWKYATSPLHALVHTHAEPYVTAISSPERNPPLTRTWSAHKDKKRRVFVLANLLLSNEFIPDMLQLHHTHVCIGYVSPKAFQQQGSSKNSPFTGKPWHISLEDAGLTISKHCFSWHFLKRFLPTRFQCQALVNFSSCLFISETLTSSGASPIVQWKYPCYVMQPNTLHSQIYCVFSANLVVGVFSFLCWWIRFSLNCDTVAEGAFTHAVFSGELWSFRDHEQNVFLRMMWCVLYSVLCTVRASSVGKIEAHRWVYSVYLFTL